MAELKKQFIRFGGIPENGKSGIYNGDLGKVGEEKGVSVYEAIMIDGKLKLILPKIKSSTIVSLEWVHDRPVYLVSGDMCGYGSDGEPLLRNCQILKQIDI